MANFDKFWSWCKNVQKLPDGTTASVQANKLIITPPVAKPYSITNKTAHKYFKELKAGSKCNSAYFIKVWNHWLSTTSQGVRTKRITHKSVTSTTSTKTARKPIHMPTSTTRTTKPMTLLTNAPTLCKKKIPRLKSSATTPVVIKALVDWIQHESYQLFKVKKPKGKPVSFEGYSKTGNGWDYRLKQFSYAKNNETSVTRSRRYGISRDRNILNEYLQKY